MSGGAQVQGSLAQNLVLFDRYKEAKLAFERFFILKKLRQNEFNISRTAELIGIERSHLYRKIKLFGLENEIEKRISQGSHQ
jgi:two-component system nitrogen regulation response regulator NtrX